MLNKPGYRFAEGAGIQPEGLPEQIGFQVLNHPFVASMSSK
jgi:hypothetical protein